MNVYIVLALGLISCIDFFVSQRCVFIFVAGIQLVILIRRNIVKKPILFHSLKPLLEYERNKLGAEWEIMERRNSIGVVILLIIFTLQAMLPSTRLPYNLKNLQFMIAFSVFLIILVNVSHYFRVRKIDLSEAETLKGYADRDLTFGVVGGLIAGIIVLGIVVVLLLQ